MANNVPIPKQKWFENKYVTALIEFLAQCKLAITLRNKHIRWHVENEFIPLSESLSRENVTGYCYCSRKSLLFLYTIRAMNPETWYRTPHGSSGPCVKFAPNTCLTHLKRLYEAARNFIESVHCSLVVVGIFRSRMNLSRESSSGS
jgi:hypothetical protein